MEIRRFICNNGYGTNAYLAWDTDTKKAFIVDPGSPLEEVQDAVEMYGLDLQYMIITHGHGDHTGGINFFKENFPDIKMIACRKERKMLLNRDISGGKGGYKADLEVVDGDTVMVGDLLLKFIECPGHTVGGMSILVDKVLFSGDTLFQRSVGRTDLYGGDWDTLLDTLKNKLFTLPEDTLVLPGHMGETTIGYEKRYNPFVV
ncbi:MAG: MBL fold metallo-hydrolase [Firmicutes bacterium]|nr:MBL fold metallo-hydrolase [Bacillota bacterium]